MHLIIVSGRSGSGKTIALHALEDLGFYCIDNLPIGLLTALDIEIGGAHPKVAVSIDSRNLPVDLFHFKDILTQLNKPDQSCTIIYLDANESTLLNRFSETRRKHPLSKDNMSLREAIRKENELLFPIASLADLVLDTSNTSQHTLHTLIRNKVEHHRDGHLQLMLQSFGFKYGLPPESDFIFDARCLPNPYWEPDLKPLTGLDKKVQQYLKNKVEVKQMLKDILSFIKNWIPKFKADNRSYLTISIGCTGGCHRSVYLVDQLAKNLNISVNNLIVYHREL